MKFLFDFFPLVLFFVVYKIANGNEAAALAMADHYLGGMVSGGKILMDQAPTMLATVVARMVVCDTTVKLVTAYSLPVGP